MARKLPQAPPEDVQLPKHLQRFKIRSMVGNKKYFLQKSESTATIQISHRIFWLEDRFVNWLFLEIARELCGMVSLKSWPQLHWTFVGPNWPTHPHWRIKKYDAIPQQCLTTLVIKLFICSILCPFGFKFLTSVFFPFHLVCIFFILLFLFSLKNLNKSVVLNPNSCRHYKLWLQWFLNCYS